MGSKLILADMNFDKYGQEAKADETVAENKAIKEIKGLVRGKHVRKSLISQPSEINTMMLRY